MRFSKIAGGGTGTSLVRIRLEPSALYWYFEAKEALTVDTRNEAPPRTLIKPIPA